MRDMLFISHANPEDNEFSRWLALRLAREGYPVWCDLTQLLGGEAFWTDIEDALRNRTAKFLFVLSRRSNAKSGPLDELQVAKLAQKTTGARDFIIPLLVDDLPHAEINIQLARLNAIPFSSGWAPGLRQLLEKIEKDGVQKRDSFGPAAVNDWWRSQHGSEQGVLDEPEEYLSNWFPASELPTQVYLHEVEGCRPDDKEGLIDSQVPACRFSRSIVSFAKANDFKATHTIVRTTAVVTSSFLEGIAKIKLDRRQARNILSYLLRDGWERMAVARGLIGYELANNAKCFWFRKDVVPDDKVTFTGVSGKKTTRQVVGIKHASATKKGVSIRYWHLGLQAKAFLYPFVGYAVKPHVLFSDNGLNLWASKDKLHRARRSQCKNWWNPRWRDLLLGAANFLSQGAETFPIPMGSDCAIKVSIQPVPFQSPVRFDDPEAVVAVDEETEEETDDVVEEEQDQNLES